MSGTEDVLAKLLPARFREVDFFPTTFNLGFGQTQVQHLYPNRDAGFIEATGREPLVHGFSVIFRNGNLLAQEVQYPDAWRKMVASMLDRSMGILLHPELGPLKVKPRSLRTMWEFGKRDGADMEVEFIETSDTEDEMAAIFNKSAAYTVEFEAGQLDGVASVSQLVQDDEELAPSLLDSIKQLNGLILTAQLSVASISSKIDAYANAIADLTDTIESVNDPANSPIVESLKRLYFATLDLVETAKPKGRPVTLVVNTKEAPTSAVAAAFGNTTEDFLNLNPSLGSRTSVPAGQSVFVFAA